MSGLRYNDRVVVYGDTGAGKSELINFLWEGFRCQRILADTKDEFSVPNPARPEEMLQPVHDPGDVDWRAPVIHYVPSTDEPEEMGELFELAYRMPGARVVAVHELSDVCGFNANKTPGSFNSYVSKGRAHGKGLLGGSQLPVNMPTRAATLAQHIMVAVPRFVREDDMRAIAKAVGQETDVLNRQLDELHATFGDHAYVWFNRRARTLSACRPLSEAHRSRITIRRRVDG